MSVEATRAIWERTGARGFALIVLLAIGDYANTRGEAWPSMTMLARKARLSERVTRRLTAKLVEDGELSVVPGGGRGKRNRFLVKPLGVEVPEKGTGVIPFRSEKGDPDDRVSGAKRGTGKAQKGDRGDSALKEVEPSYNHHIDREEEMGESSLPLFVPMELVAFDRDLRRCPGYKPNTRFYEKVLEKYAGLDLEEQAMRIADWFSLPKNRRRVCTGGFVLGWLRREAEETGRRREGETRGGRSGGRKRELGGASGLEVFSRRVLSLPVEGGGDTREIQDPAAR